MSKTISLAATPAALKERQRIYRDMKPALRAVADHFTQSMAAEAEAIIGYWYDRGKEIRDVVYDEAKCGPTGLKQLSDYLGMERHKLGALAQLADIPRQFVMAWTARPLANGNYLTITHWLALRQVKDAGEREALLRKCSSGSWSAQTLENEVKSGAAHSRATRATTGRTVSKPATEMGGLQKYDSLLTTSLNYAQVILDDVLPRVDEVPPESVSDVLVSRIDKTLEKAKASRDLLNEVCGKLEKSGQRCRRVIEKRSKAEPAPASSTAPPARSSRLQPRSSAGTAARHKPSGVKHMAKRSNRPVAASPR